MAAGYAHRLRAVGRLHEAENESQRFSDPFCALRAARNGYQTDATIPDRGGLAQAAGGVGPLSLNWRRAHHLEAAVKPAISGVRLPE